LNEIYNSDYCLTLDELPDLKDFEGGKDPIVTDPTEPTEPKDPDKTEPTTEKDPASSDDTSATTDTTATTNDLPTPSPDLIYGDYNDSGKVTISDLIGLLQVIATGSGVVDYPQLDCYYDGKVDIVDVIALVHKLLGKVENLPVVE
jgi:mannan endo-1,4-beta-mannosidase